MDVITAFGIGALVFILFVLFTAYFLKSASLLESSSNKTNFVETQEFVYGEIDDMLDDGQDTPEIVSE